MMSFAFLSLWLFSRVVLFFYFLIYYLYIFFGEGLGRGVGAVVEKYDSLLKYVCLFFLSGSGY